MSQWISVQASGLQPFKLQMRNGNATVCIKAMLSPFGLICGFGLCFV